MFPIRRAALRILSSPSTSFIARPRTISTFSPSSLRVLKQSTSVQFQRRWATSESEAPVSKLQPTPQEEVENAIHEDNSAQSINSSEQTQPAREVATENAATPSAEAPVETANMTEATEEAIPAAEEPVASRGFSDRPPRDSRRNESRPFGDRQVRNNDPKRTVYVGNLFFDVTEDDLSKELSRFGTIKNVRLIRDARGLSKGFGYVGFEDVEQATRAIAGMNQQLFEGRRLSVQFATTDDAGPRPERTQITQGARNPPSKTLFIGNMSWEMTDRDLNELFRGITNVIDVRVAIDRRTGQPRGFAHADFVDIKSAMEAEKVLQGKETYGRKLRIDYSYGPSNAPRNQARDEGQERGGRGSFDRRSSDRPQRSERRDSGEEGY